MPNGNGERSESIWQVRVPGTLDALLEDAINRDTHMHKSEFIRQAVREKLERIGADMKLSAMPTTKE